MADNVKDVILQKKIEGILYDLMLRTRSSNVIMGDGRTLAAVLAEYATASSVDTQINNRINELVAGAPEAFDTLKEIADYIEQDKSISDSLNAAIGNKVDKAAGKGLSENDFTTPLKTKLEGLVNYVHPAAHSADMITETADKQFVSAAEKERLASAGRILSGAAAPADLTEADLFLQII